MMLFIGQVILIYIITIIAIRLLGKATFAQLTAHDLTGIFFVVSLAAGPLFTASIFKAVAGIVTVVIIHIIFSRLTLVNKLNKPFIGHPTIVVKHGKLIKNNLKRSRFTLVELLSNLREKGYPDITSIEFALIETNGNISILPRQEMSPVTPKQLGIETDFQGMPMAVVIEGEIQHQNLKLIGKNRDWLVNELQATGYKDFNRIFYAAVRDSTNSLTVDTGEGDSGRIKE
ncbi:DUF421 domain-containing protein [Virgibacillus siamensis]|uniref:DUF421 domain-containing protein n=1 Tax=Virgibacillus siamensis TaxID=480071 RepID=UPI000986EA0F|nr:DUF421 domain-containing protein [Virgibacillus siamensis]